MSGHNAFLGTELRMEKGRSRVSSLARECFSIGIFEMRTGVITKLLERRGGPSRDVYHGLEDGLRLLC